MDGDYLDIVQFTHTSSFPSLMPREAPECRHPTGVTLRLTLVAVASFICGVTRIMLSPGLSIPYINNLHTILHSRSISLVSIIIQKNITNMAAQGPEEPLVDTSPISPIRPNHVRQNSLEKHLQSRPNPQELKDRHILLNTNAAP